MGPRVFVFVMASCVMLTAEKSLPERMLSSDRPKGRRRKHDEVPLCFGNVYCRGRPDVLLRFFLSLAIKIIHMII